MPVSIVRPSIIESAWAEPRPGWIRGFRMAEPVIISYARGLLQRVPRRARGHGRRHPRRPRRRRHHRRRRARPGAGAGDHPGRVGRRQPAQVPHAGRQRAAPGSPSTRCTTPRASRSSCRSGGSPGAGRVQGQLQRAKTVIDRGEQVLQALPLRGKQAELVGQARDASARRSSGRSSTSSCTACTPSARRSTRSTTCWRCWDELDAADREAFDFDPRDRRLADVHQRDPPAVDRPARPGQDRRRARRRTDRTRPAAPPGARRPSATSPRSTSRTR